MRHLRRNFSRSRDEYRVYEDGIIYIVCKAHLCRCAKVVIAMNQKWKTAISIFLLCTLSLSALAGCGRRKFEKVDESEPTATASAEPTAESTEPQTENPQGVFTFAANIRMGMTVEEVQSAIGQVIQPTVREDGRKTLSNRFFGSFVNYDNEKNVVFMFSAQTDLLEQLQFRGDTASDGMNTAETVALFDARYGKQAIYQGNYRNHIWRSDDVYILLSELDIDNYAVTYTEAGYFEQEYKEEAEAYRRAR